MQIETGIAFDGGVARIEIDNAVRFLLAPPFVESIAWGNLADINPTLPGGGLLDDMLKPKPSFNKVQELRDAITRRKA